MTQIPNDQPPVELTGQNGNAFSILGHCQRAAKKAGWTPEQIQAFREEAMRGDYDHLLGTAMKYFDVQ